MPSFSILATDKVRLVGDPVVLIVAESRYLAEDAGELVEVDYEELPAVITPEQALDPAGPPIFEDLGSNVLIHSPVGHLRRRGGRLCPGRPGGAGGTAPAPPPERADGVSGSRVQLRPRIRRAHRLFRHPGSSCRPHGGFASQLDMPMEKVRVLAGDIGGSFGLKIGAAREDIACAAASRQLGRPVRWIEDRSENLTASGQARDESFEVEAAISEQGDILGLRVKMIIDTGAYPGLGRHAA